MSQALGSTNFQFPGQIGEVLPGKVRDNYLIERNGETYFISIATDRISVFDIVLDTLIPFKGAILTDVSVWAMSNTLDIVPNWLISNPHDNVIIGKHLDMIPLEVIVRQYLMGSAYQAYLTAQREWEEGDTAEFVWQIGDNLLGPGLPENYKLPDLVVEFTRKSEHDEPISENAILAEEILNHQQLHEIKRISTALFNRLAELYLEHNILFADTKFEFGFDGEIITLADEVGTPDSSRIFYISCGQEDFRVPFSKQIARDNILENNGCRNKDEILKLSKIKGLTDAQVQAVVLTYSYFHYQLFGASDESTEDSGDIIELTCKAVAEL